MNISVVTNSVKATNIISEQLQSVGHLKFYQDTISMFKDKNSENSDLIIYDASNTKFAKDDISILLEKPEFKDKTIYILTSKKYPISMDIFKKNVLGYLIPDEVNQFIKDVKRIVSQNDKIKTQDISQNIDEKFETKDEFSNVNQKVKDNSEEEKKSKIIEENIESTKNEISNDKTIEKDLKIKVSEIIKKDISRKSIDISFSIDKAKIEEMVVNFIFDSIMENIKDNMEEITSAVRESIQRRIIYMIETELRDDIKNITLKTSNEIISKLLQDKLSSMFGNGQIK